MFDPRIRCVFIPRNYDVSYQLRSGNYNGVESFDKHMFPIYEVTAPIILPFFIKFHLFYPFTNVTFMVHSYKK